MINYRHLIVKKRSGILTYCDQCDAVYRKTGKYPFCCPGMTRYLHRSVRRRLKAETRKELHESQGSL